MHPIGSGQLLFIGLNSKKELHIITLFLEVTKIRLRKEDLYNYIWNFRMLQENKK
jgi:hypothetical protein